MTTTPTTPRRWFQFSLQTLLLLTTIVALAVFAITGQLQMHALQSENSRLRSQLSELNAAIKLERSIPNLRTMPTAGELDALKRPVPPIR